MDIWDYVRGDRFTEWDREIFITLGPIFVFQFNYLFLWLAIILNMAKWVYFYLVIKTHRSIREYEINEAIINDERDSE